MPNFWEDAPLANEVPPIPQPFMPTSREPASIADVGIASLANDPQAQIRYYAQQRGIPESRYRVNEGAIEYQDNFGKWHPEAPGLLRGIAQGVGPSIPAVTGTAAGVLSAPMMLAGPAGMAGSMGIAAAGGAGGQALREYLASQLMGQEMSPERIGMEGAYSGLGQGIGGGMTALAQRGVARDISRLDRPAMGRMEAKGQAQGIPLTPAETSNLPSLKAQQKALGNLPQSADKLEDFYQARAGKVGEAVERQLGRISPEDSAEAAGQRIKGAAGKAIKTARQARSRAARPLYEDVMTPENNLAGDVFKPLKADPVIDDAIKAVRNNPKWGVPKDLPENNIVVLDKAKQYLDDEIEKAMRQGGNKFARVLRESRDALVDEMDEAFEGYSKARAAYAGESPEVTALEKGVVGIVSKLKDTNARQAAEKLISAKNVGPNTAKVAKDALKKADPEAWQAIKRSYIEDLWQRAGREYATTGSQVINRGAKFRALLMGDLKQRAVLKNVLEPQEWKALNDLGEVLEAAGRVKPLGSDTAWNQEMMKVARDEARPLWAKVARVLRPLDWGKMIEDWATERALANRADKLVDIITQPGAAEQLKELKQLSPNSARFRAGLGHLLVTFGGASLGPAEEALSGLLQP